MTLLRFSAVGDKTGGEASDVMRVADVSSHLEFRLARSLGFPHPLLSPPTAASDKDVSQPLNSTINNVCHDRLQSLENKIFMNCALRWSETGGVSQNTPILE